MVNFKSNRAFVLLYAVLVASVVLAIGFSLANIITKQIILSSLGQSSRVAYYAADGGRNCGRFWAHFAEIITGLELSATTNVHCDKNSTPINLTESNNPLELSLLKLYGIDTDTLVNYTAYSFDPIDFSIDSQPACAKVTVFNFEFGEYYRTIILSRGFNIACNSSATNRTVSRTVIDIDLGQK